MMKKRRFFPIISFIFYLLSIAIISNAQGIVGTFPLKEKKSDFDTKYSLAFKLEYIYQHKNYGSVGIGYMNPGFINGGPCNSFVLGSHGPSINFDFKLNKKEFVWGPKLSYEY